MRTFKTTVLVPVEVIASGRDEAEARKRVGAVLSERCVLYLEESRIGGAVSSIRPLVREMRHGQYRQHYPRVEMSTLLGARDDLGREVADG